jgi:anti-sigma B factor antagonist
VPATEQFSIAIAQTEPVVLLVATGEVDAHTVSDLSAALDAAIVQHDRHVAVDANGITFIDSTGISALVAGMRRLNRSRRRLAVACEPGSSLGRALRMTGLNHTFDVHPAADRAVAALADAPMLGR